MKSRSTLSAVVGRNIQLLRRARGWSQPVLAAQVGACAPSISRWEHGARGLDVANVEKLAAAFEVEPAALLVPIELRLASLEPGR